MVGFPTWVQVPGSLCPGLDPGLHLDTLCLPLFVCHAPVVLCAPACCCNSACLCGAALLPGTAVLTASAIYLVAIAVLLDWILPRTCSACLTPYFYAFSVLPLGGFCHCLCYFPLCLQLSGFFSCGFRFTATCTCLPLYHLPHTTAPACLGSCLHLLLHHHLLPPACHCCLHTTCFCLPACTCTCLSHCTPAFGLVLPVLHTACLPPLLCSFFSCLGF